MRARSRIDSSRERGSLARGMLAAAVAVGIVSCQAFLTLDAPGAAPADASTGVAQDGASPTVDVEGGVAPAADASADASFCEGPGRADAGALFCEDFDRDPLSRHWPSLELNSADGSKPVGRIALDPLAYSAPQSLITELESHQAACSFALAHQIIESAPPRSTIELRLHVETPVPLGGNQTPLRIARGACDLLWRMDPNGTHLVIQKNGHDASQRDFAATPVGRFVSIRITVDYSDNPLISVELDGQTVLDWALDKECAAPADPKMEILFGPHCLDDTPNRVAFRFDDILVRPAP